MNFDSGLGEIDGADLVTLKGGEKVQGVFRGEPHCFRQHWVNKQPKPCPEYGCELCAKGEKSQFRFRLNIVMKNEAGNLQAKVFENGRKLFKQLGALNKEWPLDKNVIKVSREGSGLNDTVYTVAPVPNGTLTAEAEALYAKIPLVDLGERDADEGVPEPQRTPITEDSVPF